MKKTILFSLMSALVATTSFTSCQTEPEVGTVTLKFDYKWAMNGADFEMNTPLFQPMSGDTLNFSTFKHYVSNIRLMDSDSNWWSQDESYFLLDVSDPSTLTVSLDNVPAGEYIAMQIMSGVDSLRNVSGAQVGALDVANNMFWSWNTGYIFIKAEGTAPSNGDSDFRYHLGGIEAPNKAFMTRELAFNTNVTIGAEQGATVQLLSNPARLFHTYGSVTNGAMIMMPNANAAQMASDFNTWIRIGTIVN